MPPKAELGWWYQYYFATENGVLGYTKYRHDFAKLIWTIVSPNWHFSDATFDRTAAAFNNPDHVAIVISDYRWRINLVKSEPQYERLEARLAQGPVISVPTITIASDFDGRPRTERATETSSPENTRTESSTASVTTCLRKTRKHLLKP